MVNCIPFTALLKYSAACVQRGVRINGEMKIGKMASCLSFLYSPLSDCGVFSWSAYDGATLIYTKSALNSDSYKNIYDIRQITIFLNCKHMNKNKHTQI